MAYELQGVSADEKGGGDEPLVEDEKDRRRDKTCRHTNHVKPKACRILMSR